MKPYVYLSAKVKHQGWFEYMVYHFQLPVVSSWLTMKPETPEDFKVLWDACLKEASECAALVLFVDADDTPLKGALLEVGAALSHGKPVYYVCMGGERAEALLGNLVKNPYIIRKASLKDAFEAAEKHFD